MSDVIPKKDVWNKNIKVEENMYYWKGEVVVKKRAYVSTGKPTVVELFSGCGGTSTGFEMAGFDTILGADIHEPSIDTFHYNHRNATTILGDLKGIQASFVKDLLNDLNVDVMIAGVPCQGFSLNNRKRHAGDDRNFLFKEYIRFVKEVKPKVVVLENVSGMNSTANGTFVETIKDEIRKAGYPNVESRLLNAADFGVPQARLRLIFVGTREGISFSWPKETHGSRAGIPHRTVMDAIGDLPEVKPGESVSIYDKKPFSDFQRLMRMDSVTLLNHNAPSHPESTIKKIMATVPGEPMYERFKQRIRLSWDLPSPTQVSGGIRPQFQFGHPQQPRGLTVRERCRIQSFPDNFEVLGGTVQGRVQTGNAVPPLLAKAIAEEIIKVL